MDRLSLFELLVQPTLEPIIEVWEWLQITVTRLFMQPLGGLITEGWERLATAVTKSWRKILPGAEDLLSRATRSLLLLPFLPVALGDTEVALWQLIVPTLAVLFIIWLLDCCIYGRNRRHSSYRKLMEDAHVHFNADTPGDGPRALTSGESCRRGRVWKTPPTASRRAAIVPSWKFNRTSTGPGPGYYDNDSESISQRSIRSWNSAASQGRSNFMSCSKRDDAIADNSGDPGQYTLESHGLAEMSKSTHNKRNKQGLSAFGSRSSRCSETARLVDAGPHDYQHLYSCGVGNRSGSSPQATSSFRSSVPLNHFVRVTQTPGIGIYSPQQISSKDLGISTQGSSMFAGKSNQHADIDQSQKCSRGIGPGTYELSKNSLYEQLRSSSNPRLPAFSSSARRSDPTDWI
jgi:hypothetical protein